MGLFDGVKKLFSGDWNGYYEDGIIPNIWKGMTGQTSADRNTQATNEANAKMQEQANQSNLQIAQETNATNRNIAEQNLGFQRELQEYNKALQQQIFEREDTSYQRTAQDMLAAGLNPLDMQGTNGAGEVISQSPLNNGFQAQIGAPMQASRNEVAPIMATATDIVSALSSIAQSFNQVKTGQLQRDSIALDNDSKRIDNLIKLFKTGSSFDKDGNLILGDRGKAIGSSQFTQETNAGKLSSENLLQETLKTENDTRELEHKIEAGKYDSDTNIEALITGLTDLVSNGRADNSISNLEKKFPLLEMINRYLDGLSGNKDKRERGFKYWKNFWNK